MILQTKTVLPAEWSKQDGILLCWPHQSMDWHPILAEVEPVFDQIADIISQHQQLVIIAHDQNHQNAIIERLAQQQANTDNIRWLILPNNDTWCRDFGPITIKRDDQTIALDYQFNGWGNKFEASIDNQCTRQLKQQTILSCKIESIDLVLEGGSIDSDGEGTLLTTEQCLLAPNRNANLTKQQIEQQLKQQLGIERILWLTSGHLEGDDTDAHVDNLARFCSPDTIAYASCDDINDPHFESLKSMENELKKFRTMDNKPYKLIPLCIPEAQQDQGQRLPASYANFLITNHAVLMPAFNDPQDAINQDKLQSIFSDRTVTGVPCHSIIKQAGAIHCLTMQLPEGCLQNHEN